MTLALYVSAGYVKNIVAPLVLTLVETSNEGLVEAVVSSNLNYLKAGMPQSMNSELKDVSTISLDLIGSYEVDRYGLRDSIFRSLRRLMVGREDKTISRRGASLDIDIDGLLVRNVYTDPLVCAAYSYAEYIRKDYLTLYSQDIGIDIPISGEASTELLEYLVSLRVPPPWLIRTNASTLIRDYLPMDITLPNWIV